MPRAADYRHAAQVLMARSAALADAARSYRRHDVDGLGDGPVTDAHATAVGSIARRLDQAGRELRTLADLCERRADVCDDYAGAVARWLSLDERERSITRFPTRPATWAES